MAIAPTNTTSEIKVQIDLPDEISYLSIDSVQAYNVTFNNCILMDSTNRNIIHRFQISETKQFINIDKNSYPHTFLQISGSGKGISIEGNVLAKI